MQCICREVLLQDNQVTAHLRARVVREPVSYTHLDVYKRQEHIPHTVGGLQYISDILPIITAIAFFPQKFGIASYCRQWCTQLMGNSCLLYTSWPIADNTVSTCGVTVG